MRLGLGGIVVLLVNSGVVGLSDQPSQTKPPVDIPKRILQAPLKRLVQSAQAADGTASPMAPKNSKIEAGKVNWHASFDAAKTATQQSRKPILLFQLLGRLDNRFT